MRKFSKGDKVRYIGKKEEFNDYVTYGGIYEINHIDSDGDANFYDDRGDGGSCSYISERKERLFEMADEETPVEASPTVIELLANISRRLYEVEEALLVKDKPSIPTFNPTDLNGKQLRIYTGDDIDGDYKTTVTVGIDDDTGVMYVLGTRMEAIE